MKGSALIAAMILIVIGSLVIGGFILYISHESWMSKRINDSVKALYVAEAGLDKKLYEIANDNYSDIASTNFPDINDAQNNYAVIVSQAGNIYTITSTGNYHLSQRIIAESMTIFNFWDLAVFSGGATAGQVSGSTHIRGTVYVLGEESFKDTDGNGVWDEGVDILVDENGNGTRDHLTSAENAINATGGFYIGNDYSQYGGSNAIPEEFLSRITSVSTLDAGVNVKYGKVTLDGSSQIGTASVPMDMANVPDGYNPADPTGSVFVEEGGMLSDRGMFSEQIRLPNMADAYGGYSTADGGRMAYLENNGLVLSSGAGGQIPENITPATSIATISDAKGNSFSMDGEGHITINGIIYINGNLVLDKYRSDRTIYYSGKGTIVLTGNLTINTNLYTTATGATAYPANNIVGFMTPQNINLGISGTGNLKMMGIFYAGNILRTMKQTSIAGTLIANKIDMSQNVPDVFQIKDIKDNLPGGMIDVPPVITTYGWHEEYAE